MKKLSGVLLLLAGSAVVAMGGTKLVPEIDPSSAVGALALLAGGLLVIRGRRKA